MGTFSHKGVCMPDTWTPDLDADTFGTFPDHL